MADLPPLCRSALYMPATNARALEKARTLDCDVVILDLEDAVSPDRKDEARDAAVAAIAQGGFGRRMLVVRANALDTPWGADDLSALAAAGPDAVLIPKARAVDDLRRHDEALAMAPAATRIWAMVETAGAMMALADIAGLARHTRLSTLVLGLNDLAEELRMPLSPGRAPFLPLMTNAVLAARLHGLAILDGVWNALDDVQGFTDECAQAAAWGFDGKTVIHPSQIGPCNRAFSPDAARIAWAQAVVAGFDDPANRGKGAIRVNGQMAEKMHLAEARRILAIAAVNNGQ